MMRLALSLALLLASCAPPPDRPGAARQPDAGYPTIVSLNPCSDAVLAEVADAAQILALSHYSSDPSASSMDLAIARRFHSVSGSVEEVLALHPDLVIGDAYMAPATVAAMRQLGLPLVQLAAASSVAESRAQVLQLARLAGHAGRGEELVRRIDAALVASAPSPGSTAILAVVWQGGGIVPGDRSLIAELLRRTGFSSLSAARGMRQADVLPLETMLADPPRVILAAGNPHAGEDRMLRHPALAGLRDTRRERLDPALLWCGGPTIIRAAQRLAEVRAAL